MKPGNVFAGLFILLCCIDNCIAQSCLDNILNDKLYSNSENIINGRKWIYVKKYSGSPLLMENYWPEADIEYKGSHFPRQVMNFDVYNGEVIIYHLEKGAGKFIVLSNDYLSGFSYTDTITGLKHDYIYTELPGISGKSLYEDGSSGNIALFVKPVKKIDFRSEGKEHGQFIEYYEYYIKKDAGFIRISSKNQLIKLLSDHASELKRYISNKRLKINNRYPENVIDVVRYYSKLN